jgi:DNA-binding CsgD family transcriptional regulator/tetratricopeptide (TPR) repeat protein
LCRGAAALAAAESALSLLEPAGPTVELAWAQANLANRLLLIDQYDPAVELARRAQATAEPLGVAEVVSNALNTEACAAAMQGQEGAALLRRALEIAVSGRFEEQAGRAFANLYSIHCGHRQFAEAERYFLDGIDYCREHEVHTYATCLLGERANTLEKTGRWVEARTLLAEVLDRAGASPGNRLCPLTRLGTIKARTGEPGVWECLDEAMRHADGSAEPQMIVPVRRARAEAYWLEGNVAAARGEIELAAEVSATCDEWERGAVAVWLRRLLPTSVALLDVADPYRCEVEGDATSAADIWTELGCPYDAALALLGASQEAQLREALAIFENLGAAAAARITRQRMRELGVRSIPVGARAATRAHPLGLTRREREVLDLICQGHTNGEIGAKLFISAKTVDHHVSAVLMKLGAPTRRVAASEARRLGLVGAEV